MRLGKWNEDEVMSQAYTLLPSVETLCVLAGAKSHEKYHPYHAMMTPPAELVDLVLPSFRSQAARVMKVSA